MYTQASKLSTSTSDVIKIKEMFPSIGVKKIGQINEIVKGNLKPKHQINMTTKGPSHKQIIIPISNDNIVKFMKNSATHVINFNRNLRNMKSEVSVDFIRSDPVGITVVTDKVSQPSDLITIEKYIKNLESINSSWYTSSPSIQILSQNYKNLLLPQWQLTRSSQGYWCRNNHQAKSHLQQCHFCI